MYSTKELKKKYGKVKRTTCGFLIKDNKVCLGMKKVRYGVGKWNGAGGKVGDLEQFKDETYAEGMIREMKEEFDVDIAEMDKVGEILYLGESDSDVGCTYTHVFFVTKWKGQPTESEEMKPEWFDHSSIPYENMWDGDKIWLPELLKGRKIDATFTFNDDGSKILEYKMEDLNE